MSLQSTTAPVKVGPFLKALAILDKQKGALTVSMMDVLSKCVPGWEHVDIEDVTMNHLGDGAMTNLIFTISKAAGENKDLLIRIYGEGTELFFAREEETRVFQMLSEKDIGVGLLGLFANGRAEKLIHGTTFTAHDMRDPETSRKVARKMHEFHYLDMDMPKKPHYEKIIRSLLKEARKHCTGEKFQSLDLEAFEHDISEMVDIVSKVESPLVFCHNDLQYGNIMTSTEKNDVILIDFEYTNYNPRGYDVGNHFVEWCFNYHKTIDPHLARFHKYPSTQEQRNFCHAYLQEELGTEDVPEGEVEKLRKEANTFSLASHLFWALWGYLQAAQSEIDFDFIAYAQCRHSAYKNRTTLVE